MRKMTMVVAALLGICAAADAAEIDRRQRRQQERIAEGMLSGELTPGEAARLERKEASIDLHVKGARAANGGTLTPAQRRRINRRQNRVSRQIYREKHDAQRQ
jgi:hypothetical protein